MHQKAGGIGAPCFKEKQCIFSVFLEGEVCYLYLFLISFVKLSSFFLLQQALAMTPTHATACMVLTVRWVLGSALRGHQCVSHCDDWRASHPRGVIVWLITGIITIVSLTAWEGYYIGCSVICVWAWHVMCACVCMCECTTYWYFCGASLGFFPNVIGYATYLIIHVC